MPTPAIKVTRHKAQDTSRERPKSEVAVHSRFQKLVDNIARLYTTARKAQVQFAWETGRLLYNQRAQEHIAN